MRRTAAVALDGFCFSAPFLHFAYGALEYWVPTEDSTTYAVVQVAIDVFVIDPVYALIFIVTTGMIEGESLEGDIIPVIRNDYCTLVFWLMVVGLLFAPPRVYLFRRFPVKWRVLVADGIDLLWTLLACSIIGGPE